MVPRVLGVVPPAGAGTTRRAIGWHTIRGGACPLTVTASMGPCRRLPVGGAAVLESWSRARGTAPGGKVCPARTGPLVGPNFPSEDGDVPKLAGFQVRIANRETTLRQLRQDSGPTTQIQPLQWSHARRADIP